MSPSLLADLIVVVHLGYVSFVVLGLFVILLGGFLHWRFIRNFWFRVIHLAMILLVAFEALSGITCPLTEWEYRLRVLAGQQNASPMSFVARLIHTLIFYNFPAYVFTVAYCLFALAVLLSWWMFPPHLPWKRKGSQTNGG